MIICVFLGEKDRYSPMGIEHPNHMLSGPLSMPTVPGQARSAFVRLAARARDYGA